MCENDAAVDAWFHALNAGAENRFPCYSLPNMDALAAIDQKTWKIGQLSGALRELAATVPGVREWLMENVP